MIVAIDYTINGESYREVKNLTEEGLLAVLAAMEDNQVVPE